MGEIIELYSKKFRILQMDRNTEKLLSGVCLPCPPPPPPFPSPALITGLICGLAAGGLAAADAGFATFLAGWVCFDLRAGRSSSCTAGPFAGTAVLPAPGVSALFASRRASSRCILFAGAAPFLSFASCAARPHRTSAASSEDDSSSFGGSNRGKHQVRQVSHASAPAALNLLLWCLKRLGHLRTALVEGVPQSAVLVLCARQGCAQCWAPRRGCAVLVPRVQPTQ